MSTAINQYILLGFRLDYNEAFGLLETKYGSSNCEDVREHYEDNGYKKEIKQMNGMTIISDGMDGEYFYFGIVKEKAREGEFVNSFEFGKPVATELKQIQTQAQELFGREFENKPTWHVLTHYY